MWLRVPALDYHCGPGWGSATKYIPTALIKGYSIWYGPSSRLLQVLQQKAPENAVFVEHDRQRARVSWGAVLDSLHSPYLQHSWASGVTVSSSPLPFQRLQPSLLTQVCTGQLRALCLTECLYGPLNESHRLYRSLLFCTGYQTQFSPHPEQYCAAKHEWRPYMKVSSFFFFFKRKKSAKISCMQVRRENKRF